MLHHFRRTRVSYYEGAGRGYGKKLYHFATCAIPLTFFSKKMVYSRVDCANQQIFKVFQSIVFFLYPYIHNQVKHGTMLFLFRIYFSFVLSKSEILKILIFKLFSIASEMVKKGADRVGLAVETEIETFLQNPLDTLDFVVGIVVVVLDYTLASQHGQIFFCR